MFAKTIRVSALALAMTSCTLFSAAAHAEEASPIKLGASLTGATDYVWRGFSQTSQNVATFATVSASAKGFYLGAGTENVKFAGISQEYDLWGGYTHALGPVSVDVGFVRYGYVDAASKIDTLEGKVALSGKLGKVGVSAAAYLTGNYFGSHKGARYYEIGVSAPIAPKLDFSAKLGRQDVDIAGASYNTWNAGFSYALMKGVSLGVRYHDNDTNRFGSNGKARVAGSFTVAF